MNQPTTTMVWDD